MEQKYILEALNDLAENATGTSTFTQVVLPALVSLADLAGPKQKFAKAHKVRYQTAATIS